MELSKHQISEAVQSVIDGFANPLEVYALLKDLSKHIDRGLAEIESAAIIEAEKHEKTFQLNEFTITRNEGRKQYSFNNIGKWLHYKKALKEIEDAAKVAADNHAKGLTTISDDGELIEPAEVSFSKPSLTIKI